MLEGLAEVPRKKALHGMWLGGPLGGRLPAGKEGTLGKRPRTGPGVRGPVQALDHQKDKRTTPERRAQSPARLGRLGTPTGLYVPVKS